MSQTGAVPPPVFRTALVAILLLAALASESMAGDPLSGFGSQPLDHLIDPAPVDPIDRHYIDFETGITWRITNYSNLDYLVLPQMLSYRTGYVFRWDYLGGDLIVRSRLTLLGEYFARGAESRYLGFSGSPSLEWWSADRRLSFYFGAGGGLGWVDSTDIPGGQGQDLTFNWFLQTGTRFRLRDNLEMNAGLFFQHMSNRDLAEVNNGLDLLGPVLGFSWQL